MGKRIPELHEVLAVEADLTKAMRNAIDEGKRTFKEKLAHFQGWQKTYEAVNDDDPENGRTEIHELTTTVDEKLTFIAAFISRTIDCIAEKEATNQLATASFEVGGIQFEGLPATLLLNLEHRMKEVRELIRLVPTLQAGIDWIDDKTHSKEDVFKTKTAQETSRTKKTVRGIPLYEATDKHPAQVEKISEDVVVGKYLTIGWSGMITPAKKSKMLERLDTLEREIKKARMRANTQPVKKVEIGRKLMDYVLKD